MENETPQHQVCLGFNKNPIAHIYCWISWSLFYEFLTLNYLWVINFFVSLNLFVMHINKTKSVAFRPQAKYTDWATSTDQRILLPTIYFVQKELCER
jgi:hypothetical protein